MNDPIFAQFEKAIEIAHNRGDVEGARQIASDMAKMMESAGVKAAPRFRIPTMSESIGEEVKSRSPAEQLFAGVGSAPALAYQGLKGLAGRTDPQSVMEQKAIQGASPWSFGGNVAGNAGMVGVMPQRAIAQTMGAMGKTPGIVGSRYGALTDATLTAGATNAAITPGDIGERAWAAGYGAAPLAGIGGAQAIAQTGRRAATSAGQRINVGENILGDVGGERGKQLTGALRNESPDSQLLGVKPSAAMVTNDPVMQVLESGSRAKRSDLWQALDRENAAARWGSLRSAAGTPEQLAKMRADRDALTKPTRDYAIDRASWEIGQRMGDATSVARPILDTLNRLETGASRPNAAVQTLAKYVRGELEQSTTPAQLYTVRKMLTDGIANAPTSELSQAARAARPERMQLIQHIDDALNELSSGQWAKYMDQYKGVSPPISSKTALQNIVDKLERGIPEGQVPPSMGESAAWKSVGALRDRFGEKLYGTKVIDQLLPEDRKVLEALVTNLKSQSDTMRAKGVLGSHTAALGANMGRADAVTQRLVGASAEKIIPGASIFTSKVFDKYGRAAEEELANLLQNPQALAQALERAATADKITRGTQRGSAALGGALKETR